METGNPGAPAQAASIAELTALVDQALRIADRLDLPLVGIDLCNALERLKGVDGAAPAFMARGVDR